MQRFSVHDGPGIRTTVFFKGCPLRCAWCHNPETLRPVPKVAFRADRCHGLDHCVAACPQDAIAPVAARRPAAERIARDRCDACGACVDACPHGALAVVGRRVSVAALVAEVTRDQPFHAASGGGATLSGGEPTRQMAFMGAVAAALAAGGTSVGLQTCGASGWDHFAPHLTHFRFVHFDLKLIDPAAHKAACGADNGAILANARRLRDAGAAVTFRVPIVPDVSDTPANPAALAAFLGDLDVRAVTLLAYHALGEDKLERLGFPRRPFAVDGTVVAARFAAAAAALRDLGLEVSP